MTYVKYHLKCRYLLSSRDPLASQVPMPLRGAGSLLAQGSLFTYRASRESCTQFLCCTLGGFELFITSVGVQLHAGRSRASRGSCTQFLCCMLGGFELLLHPLKSQLHAGRFSTSLASSYCSKRFKIVRRPRMSVRWDQSSKSKPNNNHFNNNHFNNNHFNTDLLTNTESEYDEYDLVSRSLLGWKFVDLTALLSRQMLKKFNIELNHC